MIKIVLSVFISINCFALISGPFSAEYTKKYQSILGKEKVSSGQVHYEYPGKIRLEQNKPLKSSFVSNGRTAWYYTAPFSKDQRGEVIVQKAQDIVLISVFDNLRHGLKDNSIYKIENTSNGPKLVFLPEAAKQNKIRSIQISTKNKLKSLADIKQLIVMDSKGKQSSYEFSSFDFKKKFAKDFFIFNPPKGTKVTNNL